MKDEEREDLGRQVMDAIMRRENRTTIQQVALAAKQRLKEENLAAWQMAWAIDQLISTYAPDPTWVFGLIDQQPTATVVPQNASALSDRAKRVVEIANAIIRDGAKTVTTKAIAQRLSAEGDKGKPRHLAVAAGNILNRVGGWQRVRSGEYEPVMQQELKVS